MKLGREDFKKKKELEELRKLGAAPAAVDAEGYIINPHIPQYMAEAPWYISDGTAGLRHQRLQVGDTIIPAASKSIISTETRAHSAAKQAELAELDALLKKLQRNREILERTRESNNKKLRWPKDCCDNCGSVLHPRKECLERPRRKKLDYAQRDELLKVLDQDERVLQSTRARVSEKGTSYEGKRDRWSNFDMGLHHTVHERHEKLNEYRRRKKEAEVDAKLVRKQREKLDRQRKREEKKRAKREERMARKQQQESSSNDHGGGGGGGTGTTAESSSSSSLSVSSEHSNSKNDNNTKSIDTKNNNSNDNEESDSSFDSDFSDCSDDDDGEDSGELGDAGRVIHKRDEKTRQSVRDLRLREDTAKYLLNFDLNSAYYDPKTRSMRADPLEGMESESSLLGAGMNHLSKSSRHRGDSAMLGTGDASRFRQMRSFVWDRQARVAGKRVRELTNTEGGVSAVIPSANPTLAERIYRDFESKKDLITAQQQSEMVQVYGDASNNRLLRKGNESRRNEIIVLGQSEEYKEYSRDGKVIREQKRLVPRSKYIEDDWPGNHTSVFGSYFDVDSGQWGFACCRRTGFSEECPAFGQNGEVSASQSTSENIDAARSAGSRGSSQSDGGSASTAPVSRVGPIGPKPRPQNAVNRAKKVNPSGYISTKGFVASAVPASLKKRPLSQARETDSSQGK